MVLIKLNILCRIENFLKILIDVLHHDENIWELLDVIGWNYIYKLCSENIMFHSRQLSQDLNFAHNFFSLIFIDK